MTWSVKFALFSYHFWWILVCRFRYFIGPIISVNKLRIVPWRCGMYLVVRCHNSCINKDILLYMKLCHRLSHLCWYIQLENVLVHYSENLLEYLEDIVNFSNFTEVSKQMIRDVSHSSFLLFPNLLLNFVGPISDLCLNFPSNFWK